MQHREIVTSTFGESGQLAIKVGLDKCYTCLMSVFTVMPTLKEGAVSACLCELSLLCQTSFRDSSNGDIVLGQFTCNQCSSPLKSVCIGVVKQCTDVPYSERKGYSFSFFSFILTTIMGSHQLWYSGQDC